VPLANIAYLYLVRLKARTVLRQEALAVLGIAVGVALLFAAQIANTTLNGSVAQLTSGVIGKATYQLEGRSPTGFSESVFTKVESLPGVAHAVPILEQQALISGPTGRITDVSLLASDPRDVRLAGPLLSNINGSQLAHQNVLALTEATAKAIGGFHKTMIVVNGRQARVSETAELTEANIGQLANSPVVIAPLAFGQKLSGLPGRITRVFIQPDASRYHQVRNELLTVADGHLNLEPANFDSTLFSRAAAPVNQSTATFAFICSLVGFAFAFCSMLLTVDVRRGLIRELRRSGATQREAMKVVLFDALVLGVVASVIGLAVGDLLSLLVFGSNPGYLTFAFPVGAQRVVTWQSALFSALIGVLAASVGVLIPMYENWSRLTVDRRRFGGSLAGRWSVVLSCGALVCLGAATLIFLRAPQSAIVGVAALLVALVLLLPPLGDAGRAVFERGEKLGGRGGMKLAVAELKDPKMRLRSIGVSITAAIAVFASVAIQDSHSNLQNGLNRLVHELSNISGVWVLAPGQQNTLATVPFDDLYGARIAHLAGVQSVGRYQAGFLNLGDRRLWVLAPPDSVAHPIPSGQIISGSARLAERRLRAGGWAAISQAVANEAHLKVGDRFTLPSQHPITVRVAATITNLGWPPGAVIMASNDFRRAWETDEPTAYNVQVAHGASKSAVAREIRNALGSAPLMAETERQRETTQVEVSKHGLSRLTQIASLVLVAGVLATVTTMGQAISMRRPRYGRLKRQGVATTELWAALVWESVVLVGCGCLAGAALGIYGQLGLSHALNVVTGFPVILSAGLLFAIGAFLLVTAVAAAMLGIAGYRTASVDPMPAIQVTLAEDSGRAARTA
jgi:putative ABC transport system permease protein